MVTGVKFDQGKSALWLVPFHVLNPYINREIALESELLHEWVWNKRVVLPMLDEEQILLCGPILEFGANKYAPGNWQLGLDFTRVVSAALRHAISGGNDPETGLPHTSHFLCNYLFCYHYQTMYGDYEAFDDRPKVDKPIP